MRTEVTDTRRERCLALTQKGLQCKLLSLEGDKYCHIHIKTKGKGRDDPKRKGLTGSSNQKSRNSSPEKRGFFSKMIHYDEDCDKPGFIYVFTYAHMMNPKAVRTNNLHLAAPTTTNWIDYNQTVPFDTFDRILLKVGYTRKAPEVRINEWRKQCGRSNFILLYPGCLVPIYNKKTVAETKTLVKMFKRLSLSSESKGAKGHTGKKYKNLNKERTCFVAPHPHDTEQRIHRRLKQDYGAGKMYCEACSKEALDYRYPTKKIAGVHTEWFSIPRDQMERVWDIIEYECTI